MKFAFNSILISFLVTILLGCGGPKASADQTTGMVSEAPESPVSSGIESLDEFLDDFEKATLEHNASTLFNFFDKEYKTEQWDKLLNKNTDTFLSKFFSNNEVEIEKPRIDYKQITGIVRKSFVMNGSYVLVNYTVMQGKINVSLQITVFNKLEKGVLRYSIYGPIG